MGHELGGSRVGWGMSWMGHELGGATARLALMEGSVRYSPKFASDSVYWGVFQTGCIVQSCWCIFQTGCLRHVIQGV